MPSASLDQNPNSTTLTGCGTSPHSLSCPVHTVTATEASILTRFSLLSPGLEAQTASPEPLPSSDPPHSLVPLMPPITTSLMICLVYLPH